MVFQKCSTDGILPNFKLQHVIPLLIKALLPNGVSLVLASVRGYMVPFWICLLPSKVFQLVSYNIANKIATRYSLNSFNSTTGILCNSRLDVQMCLTSRREGNSFNSNHWNSLQLTSRRPKVPDRPGRRYSLPSLTAV